MPPSGSKLLRNVGTVRYPENSTLTLNDAYGGGAGSILIT
jgi:hypothetical protein